MLVIVHPMTSYSGSVAYLKYVSNTNKGGISQGDEFNSVFKQGAMTDDRANFTSQAVVESFTSAETPAAVAVAWTPLKKGVFTNNNTTYDFKLIKTSDNTVTYGNFDDDGKIPAASQAASTAYKVAYKYNQEYVPAENIPTIGPKMERIALVAEPRRIAVKYDQITA